MTRSTHSVVGPIRFMTFNIRFDTILDAESGNRWAARAASVVELLHSQRPDVVGFQEALKPQLADLTVALPHHRGVGRPRDVGDTAEYVPLFFDARRFELEEHGDFWLSPTPDVEGSRGWDTDVPRHCTWTRLKERGSSARFAVFNTHLDVKGSVARLEAAKLIVARIAIAPELPSVVMGDLNATEDADPLATFRGAGFRDTFREIHPEAVDVQTVHQYTELSGSRKIDYIMCDRRWQVLGADIIRDVAAGRLPSDHFPVSAELLPARHIDDPPSRGSEGQRH
jgi:endonuclease/exonuclease/phosphatase family metal-dependent hydrolase